MRSGTLIVHFRGRHMSVCLPTLQQRDHLCRVHHHVFLNSRQDCPDLWVVLDLHLYFGVRVEKIVHLCKQTDDHITQAHSLSSLNFHTPHR